MQPLPDNSAQASNGASASSISWTHIMGNGLFPYLIVAVLSRTTGNGNTGNSVVASLTYGGVALTRLTSILFQSPSQIGAQRTQRLELFYLAGGSTFPRGTNSIVATLTGTTDVQVGASASFFNTRPKAPEATNTNTSTSPGGSKPISTNITTLSNFALVVECCACANISGWTVNAGQTEIVVTAGNPIAGAIELSYKILPTPGGTTLGVTNSNAESLAEIVTSIPLFFAASSSIF